MFIRLIGNPAVININCESGILSHITNSLSMKFGSDSLARETETLLKQQNIKTKHNDCEITILNVSDYEIAFG